MCTEGVTSRRWLLLQPALLVGVRLVWLAALFALSACSRTAQLGVADYASLHLRKACMRAERPGPAGGIDRLMTRHDIPVSLRTPVNYDPTLAHPLLVVFAPGAYDRFASEAFYGLTREATTAGFIIAYPDHVKLSLRAFEELGQVPALVAIKWCVDSSRVYFAGHSDGGTPSAAVTFLGKSALPPRAVAISAAGIRREDLQQYACPPPLSVLVIHSRSDELFTPPAYGEDPARWWAACNKCELVPATRDRDGCVEYNGCALAVRTRYCEPQAGHRQWPVRNAALLAFFSAPTEPAGSASSQRLAPPP
jgi:polyhydroxybutyrate depolymerase